MYDFIRFFPRNLINLGFKSYVLLSENEIGCGRIVRAKSIRELRQKLRRIREDVIVGVVSEDQSVLREAVMRKKVDIILDFDGRELDFSTIKLASSKDVAIEFGLSKFIKSKGLRRVKLIEGLRQEIKIVEKFNTPFIITSAAESPKELRTRNQVETFFSYFGCDVIKARSHSERIIRRYYDPKFVMDGFEIEQ